MAKIRMGMVGGGDGAFIGAIHRRAAALDGEIELVCGAFSSDAARSLHSGKALHLPASRVYPDYTEMMAAEAALPADARMQFVAIVTPNHLHLPMAEEALRLGCPILIEKPLADTAANGARICDIAEQTGVPVLVGHHRRHNPLVAKAREIVDSGALGP